MLKNKPSKISGKPQKQKKLKQAKKKPLIADKVVKIMEVKGKGDYFGDLLGNLGSKVGQWAGNSLQSGFRKLTGFGDYRTNGPIHNSLLRRKMQGPSEAPFTMGAMDVKFAGAAPRVQHREFIGPVLSTGTAFATTSYRIQPGVTGSNTLFPWGSSVARCFQQYILHGMILEYVSTSSEYAANSALGSVMLSTVYDATQPPLGTPQAVNNNDYTTVDKPSVSFYHPVECAGRDSQVTVRYVTDLPPSSGDVRLTDVGNFQVSTLGITAPAGSELGELWCTYDVEYLKSELPVKHNFSAIFTAPITAGTPGTFTPNSNNTLPATVSGYTITMPPGYVGAWLATVQYQSTVAGAASLALSNLGSSVIPKNVFVDSAGGIASVVATGGGATERSALFQFCFSVGGTGTSIANSFQIPLSTAMTGYYQVLLTPAANEFSSPFTAAEPAAMEDRLERLEALLAERRVAPLIVSDEECKDSDQELIQIIRSSRSASRK